eukprot:gene22191-30432_t
MLKQFYLLSTELQHIIFSYLGGLVVAQLSLTAPASKTNEIKSPLSAGYAKSKTDEQTAGMVTIMELCRLLQLNVRNISEEFEMLRRSLSSFHEAFVPHPVSRGEWRVFHLMEEGMWNSTCTGICPTTFSVLQQFLSVICEGSCFGSVYFSVLSPHTSISPHCGATNTKLRLHLPLICTSTPSDDNSTFSDCFLTVNNDSRPYVPGRAMVFDDSFLHSACNHGDRERVVLLIDIWHPDLSSSAIEELTSSLFISEQNDPIMCDTGHILDRPDDDNDKILTKHPPLDYRLKILLIGDTGCGRSSFMERWCSETFVIRPIWSFEYRTRTYRMRRNKVVLVHMWDSFPSGTLNHFRDTSYYRNVGIVFVLADVTRPPASMYASIDKHLRHIMLFANRDLTVFVVGTKRDLAEPCRFASCQKISAYVADRGFCYFESSSKTGFGVQNIVRCAIKTHLTVTACVDANLTQTNHNRGTQQSTNSSMISSTLNYLRSRCTLS